MPNLRSIVSNGSSSNRVDIIFMGDGYTTREIGSTYNSHIGNYLEYIFEDNPLTQPFGRYENFFNIHSVDVISNQSGADDPASNIERDTALGATYRYDGTTDRLLYVNQFTANTYLNSALRGTNVDAEMRYIIVNSEKYGGGGGYYGVYAGGNDASKEIALHEIGHSFAGLGDEYGGSSSRYSGDEPPEINLTLDPTGAEWSKWIGYVDPILGPVGSFEGGAYYDRGVYRPTLDSKMRSLNRPFDPISREEFVHRFYDYVDPIDSHDQNSSTVVNARSLRVEVIDPQVISVDWTINGTTFSNIGEMFSLEQYGYNSGSFQITARAYDTTDWVRGDRSDLEQTVTWTVQNNYVRSASVADGVHRFFNTQTGGHFFTISDGEAAQVRQTRPDLRPEGTGFGGFSADQGVATEEVYRFFNTRTGGHFFTTSESERDEVIATNRDYRLEGVGFFDFIVDQGTSTEEVYRFFNTNTGGHFFTASESERDQVLATNQAYRYEGIAFYAPDDGAALIL